MNLLSNYNSSEIFLIRYVFIINIISYFIFKIDKYKAENKQFRISENLLLFISLIGGSIGSAISMIVNKHKLSKSKFFRGIPLMIILNTLGFFIILNRIK